MNEDALTLGAYILAMVIAFWTGWRLGHADGREIERMNSQRLTPKMPPARNPPPWNP